MLEGGLIIGLATGSYRYDTTVGNALNASGSEIASSALAFAKMALMSTALLYRMLCRG